MIMILTSDTRKKPRRHMSDTNRSVEMPPQTSLDLIPVRNKTIHV